MWLELHVPWILAHRHSGLRPLPRLFPSLPAAVHLDSGAQTLFYAMYEFLQWVKAWQPTIDLEEPYVRNKTF